MNIQTVTAFFKWCSIINIGMLIFSTLILVVAQDLIYSFHGMMFDIPREGFNVIVYAFIGLYKVLIIVFSLVPYVALKIMAKNV